MGTDFTFRDLEILGKLLHWTDEEATAKLLGEDAVGGRPSYQIELRPQQEGMPYQRLVLWIDHDRLIPLQVDFYDRRGSRKKELVLRDVRDVGAIPTAYQLEMRDLAQGGRTVVDLSEVEYDTGLPDDLFTKRSFQRGGP